MDDDCDDIFEYNVHKEAQIFMKNGKGISQFYGFIGSTQLIIIFLYVWSFKEILSHVFSHIFPKMKK